MSNHKEIKFTQEESDEIVKKLEYSVSYTIPLQNILEKICLWSPKIIIHSIQGRLMCDIKQKNPEEYRKNRADKAAKKIVRYFTEYMLFCNSEADVEGAINFKINSHDFVDFLNEVMQHLNAPPDDWLKNYEPRSFWMDAMLDHERIFKEQEKYRLEEDDG